MSEDLSFSSGKHRFLDLPFTKPARNLFHHRPIELLAFKATLKEDTNIQETTPQTLLLGYIFKQNKSAPGWRTPTTEVKVSKQVVKKLTTSILSPFSCPLFRHFGKFALPRRSTFLCVGFYITELALWTIVRGIHPFWEVQGSIEDLDRLSWRNWFTFSMQNRFSKTFNVYLGHPLCLRSSFSTLDFVRRGHCYGMLASLQFSGDFGLRGTRFQRVGEFLGRGLICCYISRFSWELVSTFEVLFSFSLAPLIGIFFGCMPISHLSWRQLGFLSKRKKKN